jgi:hypothetical protein
MRRALMVFAAGLLGVVATVPAASARQKETHWVRGTVTAVSDGSISVKVKEKDFTFAIDRDTEVIAPGAGTKTRAAQKAGEGGIKVPDVVKVGQAVEVRYHDMGATLHAATIRAGISGRLGETSFDRPRAQEASGTVSAVTGDSLTISSGGQSWTFSIDKTTTVVGRGVGTLGREKKEEGGGLRITDAVAVGDTVRVSYHDTAGTKHAATVTVTRKGTKT